MCKPKDMILAIIGAFVGFLIVEFTLGWLLMDYFKANNPVANPAVGMVELFGFIIGSAIVFGILFAYLVKAMKVKKAWLPGAKLGILYGLIVMFSWVPMAYFLTTYPLSYLIGSGLYGLVEYGVAGLFAMLLLAKFGTK